MKKLIGLCVMLLVLTGCAGNIKDGVAFLEEGKYEEAIEAFRKDIQKERNLDEAYHGLGIAYFELENYEEAVMAFESAIEHDAKDSASLCSFLGACYLETGEYESALRAYEKALSEKDLTEHLEQEIQWNLIAVYENMGNWETAKEQIEKYIEMYPDDSRVEKEAEFLETR